MTQQAIRLLSLGLLLAHLVTGQQPADDATTTTTASDKIATTNGAKQFSPTSLENMIREIASRPTTTVESTSDKPLVASSTQTQPTTPTSTSNTPTNPTTTTTTAATTTQKQVFQNLKPLTAPKCTYNNQTYALGDKWNDYCDQVCQCVAAPSDSLAITACKPRCQPILDAPGKDCTLVRSRLDECCLVYDCREDLRPPQQSSTLMSTNTGQINLTTTEIAYGPSSMQTVPVTSAMPLTAQSLVSIDQTSSVANTQIIPSTTTNTPVTTTTTTTSTTTTTTTSAPSTATPTVSHINAPRQPRQKFKSCISMSHVVEHGERVPSIIQPPNEECEQICTCENGNIICAPKNCPDGDVPPADLNCPLEVSFKVENEPGACCPTKWVCIEPEDYILQGINVTAQNATSVVVEFMLPLYAVGRRGKVELKYFGGPDLLADEPSASANWTVKSNIKTKDGTFPSQLIKYTLNNLKPAHQYWFKMAIHFAEDEKLYKIPLSSAQVLPVVMPSLYSEPEMIAQPAQTTMLPVATASSSSSSATTAAASSTTTSTTTTTTTTPPSTISSTSAPISSSVPSITRTITPRPSKATTTQTPAPVPTINNDIDNWPFSSTERPVSPQSPTGLKPSVSDVTPCNLPDQDLKHPIAEAITVVFNNFTQTSLHKYAAHLLVALSVMTVMFMVTLYLYMKKSPRVFEPITPPQSGFDNPSFTKLVSYYANQPPHALMVDENSQNYNNDLKQKNYEADSASPHRQHLI